MIRVTINACIAILLVSMAHISDAAAATGFYGAVDFGKAHHSDYNCRLIPPEFSCNTNANAERIGVGYWVSKYFGMEANYGQLGSIKWSGTGRSPNPNVPGEGKITTLQFSVVVAVPLFETSLIFGKIGPTKKAIKIDNSVDTNVGISYGFGTQYNVSEKFAIRVQYEESPNTNNSTGIGAAFSFVSAGVVLRF